MPANADGARSSSRERVLASIKAGVNVLVKGMNELGLRTCNDRDETASLEEGVQEQFRSVRRFVGISQDACTAVRMAQNSDSGMYAQNYVSCEVEDHVLLKLIFHPFDSEYPYDLWRDDTFTHRTLAEDTNLDIQILMSSIANSVGLFAKITGPAPWRVPDIEPLPSDYQSASPSTPWIRRTLGKESERPTDSAMNASFSLRCMVGLPPPVPKQKLEITCLNFLVKIRRGYTNKR